MADITLTQAEADALIGMEKRRSSDDQWDYPALGGSIAVPLTSVDKRESFLLDVRRGRIDLLRGTYQNRSRNVIVLLRLDLGQPHRNPDGEEIHSPHLHVYREGYHDKWAMPLPKEAFTATDDLWTTLQEFMRYCNVVEMPNITRGLFV